MVEPRSEVGAEGILSGGSAPYHVCSPTPGVWRGPVHSRRQHVSRSDGTYRIERSDVLDMVETTPSLSGIMKSGFHTVALEDSR
ncbi:hypothetical protein TNCV_2275051 [Trichonephila clavipes]|nr:hypothetical protein TNCV_2275051 [Trichonephila clavipes]